MHLLSDYNAPYLGALFFVLLFGMAEIISLIAGHMLSGIIDAHIGDIDTASPDYLSQVLHYLNVGRLPALVVLILLCGAFGLSGILIQHIGSLFGFFPINNSLLAPACFLLSVVAVHYIGKKISRWLPQDESSAISEDEFIGRMAVITGPAASCGTPCEAKFTDKHGQTHYVLLEPEEGHLFTNGDRVLIVGRLSATRYLGEINPWPSLL